MPSRLRPANPLPAARGRYSATASRVSFLAAATAFLAATATADPALAYTPQTFNSATDKGIVFSSIPANASFATIQSALAAVGMSNFWGFAGDGATGSGSYKADGTSLWIESGTAIAEANGTKEPWQNAGFMSNPTGCSAGFSYGHFHWRAMIGYDSGQLDQGPGANLIMWNANNANTKIGSLASEWPGGQETAAEPTTTVGEVDIYETTYGSDGQGYSTWHWSTTSGGTDDDKSLVPLIYPSGSSQNALHDYDAYWSAGKLDIYIDGIFEHSIEGDLSASVVALDYAHGGCNYTIGAQMATNGAIAQQLHTSSDQLLLVNMWWDASTSPSTPVTTPNTLTLNTPSGLTAGTAFTLTGTLNFTLPSSVYLVVNKGTPVTLTPSGSSGSFSLSVPGSDIAAGTDTLQVDTTDGATLSNVVSVAVAAPPTKTAPTGSVPQPSPFYADVQNIPVTLSSTVTSAIVDWRVSTGGKPAVGDSDNVKVTGIGTSSPVAENVPVDQAGTPGAMWLSLNGGAFVTQFTASPTAVPGPTPMLTLNAAGPFTVGQSCNLTGSNNFNMTNTDSTSVVVNGTAYGEAANSTGESTGSTYSLPCPPAVTAAAGAVSVYVESAGTSSNTVTATVTAPVLTGVLPSPFYTGVQSVSGTNGVTGLQVEAETGSTAHTTPGSSPWVNATVNSDGTWSAPLTFATAGSVAHVFAENGGSTTVVDLVDGTPTTPATPPPNSISIIGPGTIVYGSGASIAGTTNYTPATPVITVDGVATALTATYASGSITLPVPATLSPGLHTERVIDGVHATSNQVIFLVDYNTALATSAINAELATADNGAALKAKIDGFLKQYIALGH